MGLRQEASRSSYDMMKIAENALEHFQATKQVFFVERAPRHDNKQKLSEFANEEMHRILADSKYKASIKILKHTLDFPEGKARDSVYGTTLTYPNYDGYHLRADNDGPGKDRAMTKSLLNALKSSGLNRKVPQTDSVKPTQVGEKSTENGNKNKFQP